VLAIFVAACDPNPTAEENAQNQMEQIITECNAKQPPNECGIISTAARCYKHSCKFVRLECEDVVHTDESTPLANQCRIFLREMEVLNCADDHPVCTYDEDEDN
jgi:hypothetical protein